MTILSQDFVFAALQSKEEFPIDFDDVWEPLGYSRKDNAVRKLLNDLEPEDFASSVLRKRNNNSPIDKYHLSRDGFKHFCLLAKTKQGREVRKHFIDIEKAYLQNLERSLLASVPTPLLSIEPTNTELFPHAMTRLINVTGTSKANLVRICKIYLIENVHFQKEIGKNGVHLYFFADQIFFELVVSVRSKRGIDLTGLPETTLLNLKDFTSHTGKKTVNKVLPSRFIQLNLF